MSPDEVSELLEYSDIIKKRLTKNVNTIQAQLANCRLMGQESEAYIGINTIKKLIDDLDNTGKGYKEFINKKDKKEK